MVRAMDGGVDGEPGRGDGIVVGTGTYREGDGGVFGECPGVEGSDCAETVEEDRDLRGGRGVGSGGGGLRCGDHLGEV